MTLAPVFRQVVFASAVLVLYQDPVPQRPAKAVFQSEPGKPSPLEIAFEPQTHHVKMTVAVEDPSGYLVPNLRPEHFAVYEDGVLQKNVAVAVDHAAVSMSVLLEGGGRYQELNQLLSTEIPSAARPLLDALTARDKVAVYAYADTVRLMADVSVPHERIYTVFNDLKPSSVSEANLYDALIDTLKRTQQMPGRRALLLISTGLDSFSYATFDDVVAAAEHGDTPVYCIGLADLVQRNFVSSTGPLTRIDWNRANHQLETVSKVSNGRTYLRDSLLDAPAIYDDMMEHLRVRYIITYTSSGPGGGGTPRRVRVALVDPHTGRPLRITDASGKVIAASVSGEASYTP
jgi:Ca-activated chloride channel family protein